MHLVHSVAGSASRVCINWPAVSLGHEVKFWCNNMLDSLGVCNRIWAQGAAYTVYSYQMAILHVTKIVVALSCISLGAASDSTVVLSM